MSSKNKIDNFFNQSFDIKRNKRSLSEKLRITLPLLAALILGLLILAPSFYKDDITFAFKITTPKSGEVEKLMVEGLNFYVTDAKNMVHNFTAKNIEEVDNVKKITKITSLDGVYNAQSGNWFNITSNEGFFYKDENLLKLPNAVDVFYSDGFEMDGKEFVIDFSTSKLYSKKPVKGNGFLGNIDAQGFEFNQKTGVVTFLGKVKIVRSEGL